MDVGDLDQLREVGKDKNLTRGCEGVDICEGSVSKMVK